MLNWSNFISKRSEKSRWPLCLTLKKVKNVEERCLVTPCLHHHHQNPFYHLPQLCGSFGVFLVMKGGCRTCHSPEWCNSRVCQWCEHACASFCHSSLRIFYRIREPHIQRVSHLKCTKNNSILILNDFKKNFNIVIYISWLWHQSHYGSIIIEETWFWNLNYIFRLPAFHELWAIAVNQHIKDTSYKQEPFNRSPLVKEV